VLSIAWYEGQRKSISKQKNDGMECSGEREIGIKIKMSGVKCGDKYRDMKRN
jgi:hypothetical protein